jgi:hypothetical protein
MGRTGLPCGCDPHIEICEKCYPPLRKGYITPTITDLTKGTMNRTAPCPTCSRFTAPIVCICGSTRFKQSWISENARLTGEGNIVLAVGLWGHHERVFPDEATKKKLDELHLRKIDLCDWVWVLDVGGYIGESTRNEIAYAEAHGKQVRYLSKEIPEYIEPVDPLLQVESALAELRGRITVEGMEKVIYKAAGDFQSDPSVKFGAHWKDQWSGYIARALRDYLMGEGK